MMRSITTLCLICTSLCAGYSDGLAVQRSEDAKIFQKADSLYAAENYHIAAIEYDRVVYKSPDRLTQTQALIKKAQCLKKLHQFEGAVTTLERVRYHELPDTLTYHARYETALCAYLNADFPTAELHLLQLFHFVRDTTRLTNARYLYALTLNELQKWDKAGQEVIQLVQNSTFPNGVKDSLLDQARTWYASKNHPRIRTVRKAHLLSMFIPGAGQVYAGYPWEGLTNALLQGATLGLTMYAIVMRYYVTAILAGGGFFQKLRLGAQHRLEYLVEQKNHEVLRNYNDHLKQFILYVERRRAT